MPAYAGSASGPGSTLKVPLNLKAAKASFQHKAKTDEQATAQQVAVEEERPTSSKAFTLQQLQQHWQAFFVQLKSNNGSPIELMLAGAALELKENYEVHVLLSSSLQEEPFERLKPKVQHHLRQQLHNMQLNLIPRLNEDNGPRRLYTNSEKFQHLLQRYPLLGELKEKLGLEADF